VQIRKVPEISLKIITITKKRKIINNDCNALSESCTFYFKNEYKWKEKELPRSVISIFEADKIKINIKKVEDTRQRERERERERSRDRRRERASGRGREGDEEKEGKDNHEVRIVELQ
jgi:adenylate kinase